MITSLRIFVHPDLVYDPEGLMFEARVAARAYAMEHGIGGRWGDVGEVSYDVVDEGDPTPYRNSPGATYSIRAAEVEVSFRHSQVEAIPGGR